MAGSSSIRWTDQAHEHLCTISICWAMLFYLKNSTTLEQRWQQSALDWFLACRDALATEPTSSADRMTKMRSRIWTRFEKAIKRGKIETVPCFRSLVRSQLESAHEALATALKPHLAELISRGQLRATDLQRILITIADDGRPYTKRTAALETLGLALVSVESRALAAPRRSGRRPVEKPPAILPAADAQSEKPGRIPPVPDRAPLDSLPDDAKLSARAIADHFGLNAEALRKRLDRYRTRDRNECAVDLNRVDDQEARTARYIYRFGRVKHIVADMLSIRSVNAFPAHAPPDQNTLPS